MAGKLVKMAESTGARKFNVFLTADTRKTQQKMLLVCSGIFDEQIQRTLDGRHAKYKQRQRKMLLVCSAIFLWHIFLGLKLSGNIITPG